ncbi:hypothetical protein DDJ66_31675, partial [Klebsiella oxytoca]
FSTGNGDGKCLLTTGRDRKQARKDDDRQAARTGAARSFHFREEAGQRMRRRKTRRADVQRLEDTRRRA